LKTANPGESDPSVPIAPMQRGGELDAGSQRDLEPATTALSADPSAADNGSAGPRVNPWLFVPVLYILQAMPVTTVQEMFTFTW
jgi:hypothetical protein